MCYTTADKHKKTTHPKSSGDSNAKPFLNRIELRSIATFESVNHRPFFQDSDGWFTMSYAYLFKYIIIGDTGVGKRYAKHWFNFGNFHNLVRSISSVVCCFSSPTRDFNLSTT